MIEPLRTHTGIRCSGASTISSSPPRTVSPDQASIHSPAGSATSRSRAASSSTGATHSDGPYPYASAIAQPRESPGSVRHSGRMIGSPVRAAVAAAART